MVEMPGVKDPERMRRLLQGSANLEFWETYTSQEIAPYLQQLDSRLANGETEVENDSVKADADKVVAEVKDTAAVAEEKGLTLGDKKADAKKADEKEDAKKLAEKAAL